MAEKITFIGYDLGDGETITDLAVLSEKGVDERIKTTFADMTMPDSNQPGKAIPTAFGYDKDGNVVFASSILEMPDEVRDIHAYFKRCPSDLLGPLSQARLNAIEERLSVPVLKEKGVPSQEECPELYSGIMERFTESVVTFTNAVFEDAEYKEAVRGQSVNSSRIVICVGHPTKWKPLDVAIYRAILSRSVLGEKTYLGMPTELILAAESRAAFLYVKNEENSFSLGKEESVLLIDVGSSTIDVSALTMDSRNVQFNSGSNYMGARSIDYLIQSWYIESLAKNPEDWAAFRDMCAMNESLDKGLTLCCRMAKEVVFSTQAGRAQRIFLGKLPPVRLNVEQVVKLASEKPVGPVLKQYLDVSPKVADSMGQKTWVDLFREFIQECRAKMEAENIHVTRIILTGSASKMPFVRKTVQAVYGDLDDDAFVKDMNPSRSISQGLALVGPSALVAERFSEEIRELMETGVPKCIEDNLPALADKLSSIICNVVVEDIIKKHVRKWRNRGYTTLNGMTAAIRSDCQRDRLAPLLENNKAYNQAIQDWMTNKVGADIALRMMKICERFGVKGITLDSLNVMKVPDVQLGELNFGPLDGIMDAISVIVGVIAGIITATILPSVIAAIILLISVISVDIAYALVVLISFIPGGLPVLVAIGGVAVAAAVMKGGPGAKEKMAELIQGYNLPPFARNLLSDEKVDEQMKKPDKNGKTMTEKIRDAILEKKSRAAIVSGVKDNISEQIAKRADSIMYVL